jgi:hypothetical protein
MKCCISQLWVAAAVFAGALGIVALPALAVDDPNKFELDGDAAEGPAAGPDWQTINNAGVPGGDCTFITSTGVIVDPDGQTVFTGGRKDLQQISLPQAAKGPNNIWAHTSQSVPDKDDLTNAYAAAFDCSGELVIYFGADRIATDGNAFLAFWFFQENVQALPDGTFSGRHQVDDFLVLVNFENGGTVPDVGVFKWVGTGGDITDAGVGTLQTVIAPGSAQCTGSGGKDVCAITNDASIPLFWTYTPKGGMLNDPAPPRAFFEGGINIDQVLGANDLCIAAFMAESRASSSVTAALKDFVLDRFEVCGLNATKVCTAVGDGFNDDFTAFEYQIDGTVSSTRGTLFDVDVLEDVTMDGPTGDDVVIASFASVDTTPVFWGPITFETTTNAPTDQIYARAASSPGGDQTIISELAPATCPPVDASPDLSVTKVCRTCLTVESDMVKVTVLAEGQVCNEGDLPLTAVTVTDDRGTTDTADDETISLGSLGLGACVAYATTAHQPATVNSPDPSSANFTDEVTASATTSLGFPVADESIEAFCELCPCVPGGDCSGDVSGISCPPLP